MSEAQQIPVKIAIKRAAEWWDKTGRRIMRKTVNQEEVGRKFRASSGMAPSIVTQGEKRAVIKSGILQCLEFSQLSKREQIQIVKIWREFHAPDAEIARSQETRETMQRLRLQ